MGRTGRYVAGLVTAMLTCAGSGWAGETIGALKQKGDAAFAAFDNRTAYEYYRQAFELDPHNAELLTQLAWSCNNAGEDLGGKASEAWFEKAVHYAEALRPLTPDRSQTWFLLALTKGNLGLFRGGKEKVVLARNMERDSRRAIELDPDYTPAYIALGVYYREASQLNRMTKAIIQSVFGGLPGGTLEQAEQTFLLGIQKNPDSLHAHYQLGQTYELMKKPDRALVYYRKTLELPLLDHQDASLRQRAGERIKALEPGNRTSTGSTP